MEGITFFCLISAVGVEGLRDKSIVSYHVCLSLSWLILMLLLGVLGCEFGSFFIHVLISLVDCCCVMLHVVQISRGCSFKP